MTEPLDLEGLRLEAEAGIGIYNPATILALLDEIDRLNEVLAVERDARRDHVATLRSRIEELEKER